MNFATLRFAQYFACAAYFQVMHSKVKTGAQFFQFLNRIQPFFGLRGERLIAGSKQVGVGLVVSAPRVRVAGAIAPGRSDRHGS